jgi:trans-2,3-dihydro-3-hydroxyanthranilate isomerase
MAALSYLHLDVFTDRAFTGNQLAVFLEPAGPDEALMQRIANELAFPETTFVFPAELPGTDARVRIFTPARELPMAGHPTIGTTFALAAAGRLPGNLQTLVLGLGVGPTPVRLEWGPAGLRFAWMTQAYPTFGPTVDDRSAVAAALGVEPADVVAGKPPVQVASSGVPFLYVPLTSRAAVDRVSLDRGALRQLLSAVNLAELPLFVFSLEAAGDGATAYSRMLAPVFGIHEDPATGGASGPLGGYLFHYGVLSATQASRLVSLQGVRMGRPSRIHVALRTHDGAPQDLQVGGEAVVVGEGTIRT